MGWIRLEWIKEIKVDEEKGQVSIVNENLRNNGSDISDALTCREDGEEMLIGFSQENTEAETFDWEKVYGSGFDAKEAPKASASAADAEADEECEF